MRRLVSALMIACMLTAVPLTHAAPADGENEMMSTGPRRHLGNIVFAGVAGAILGLSTLSFYGRPQDKLSNIAVGFAIGVISGTIYTTYKAAAEPKDFYNYRMEPEAWRLSETDRFEADAFVPRAGYTFTF